MKTAIRTTMRTRSIVSRTTSLLVLIALASATSEASTQIFSFGGDYISGVDVNLAGDTPANIVGGGSDQYGDPDGYPLPSSLVGREFSSVTTFNPTLAEGYSGQLAMYKAAVEEISGKPVSSMWIHMPVGGGSIELRGE